MISVEKFLKLEPNARLRKLWRLLHVYETGIRQETGEQFLKSESHRFFVGLLHAVSVSKDSSDFIGLWSELSEISQCLAGGADRIDRAQAEMPAIEPLLFAVNAARHRISRSLGREAAEWDLFARTDLAAETDRAASSPYSPPVFNPLAGGMAVYCDDIRSPFNVGSVFRTALAFGFAKVYLSPACPSPLHPRAERTAMGAVGRIPWAYASIDEALVDLHGDYDIPFAPVFALEQGGQDIDSFNFPKTGLVVIGSEELGVSPGILARCERGSGIASVYLPGPKASLNVASAFAILAHRWART